MRQVEEEGTQYWDTIIAPNQIRVRDRETEVERDRDRRTIRKIQKKNNLQLTKRE